MENSSWDHQDDGQEPAPVRAGKRFAVLILGLMAISAYCSFVPPAERWQAESSAAAAVWAVLPWLPWLIMAWLLFHVVYKKAAVRTAEAGRNADAVVLLNMGQLDEAARIWDRLLETAPPGGAHYAIYLLNRGQVDMQRGEFDAAIVTLKKALALSVVKNISWRELEAAGCAHLAACYALAGVDLDAAGEFLHRAETLASLGNAGLLVYSEALVDLRQNKFERVAKRTAELWAQADALLPGPALRRLRVLRAYALSRLPSSPERAEELQVLAAAARPLRAGEYDGLACRWPGLRDFIARQGLAAPPQSAPVEVKPY